MMDEYYRVYASIDLDAIYNNVKNLKANTATGTKMIAVIKTDGYGHGAVPIAKVLDDLVWGYAVATCEEGLVLRQNGIKKPVLILGYTHQSRYEDLIEQDIMPAIYTYEDAEKLSAYAEKKGKRAKVHIKIDTGMSRIGFPANDETIEVITAITKLPGIETDGIFTHFFASDAADKSEALKQFRLFKNITDKLKERGIDIPIKHCSNSAAIIDMPEVNMDCVRAGIAMYGMYPSDEVDKSKIKLTPAMSLKSHIIHLKELEKGVGVGYGATYVTERKTLVATIPVGYGDGYKRSLSNKGYVLIHGQRAPIIGRVCMDQFMVDVTEVNGIKRGDEVTLLGKDGTCEITAEEMAELAGGTFNYEIVCDIGKRVPRVFVKDGKVVGTKDYFTDSY